MQTYSVGFNILIEANSQDEADQMVRTFLQHVYDELGWDATVPQMTEEDRKRMN
jgi:hypothetical protein